MKVRIIGVFVIASLLLLAACGSSDDSSGSDADNGSGGDTAAAEVAAAKERLAAYREVPTVDDIAIKTPLTQAPDPKKVAFLRCELPTCDNIAKQVEIATEALGWETTVVRSDTADPLVGWADAFAANPDFIIHMNGLPVSAYESVLAEAKDKDIPVFSCYGTEEPTGKDGNFLFSQCSDLTAEPRLADIVADWITVDSGAKGKVVMPVIESFPSLPARADATEKALAKACTACTFATMPTTYDDLTGGRIGQQLASYLQANTDVDYAYLVEFLYSGIPDTLESAGLLEGRNIVSTGIADNPAPLTGLADGVPGAVVMLTSAGYNGWLQVDAAARVALGMSPDEERLGVDIPMFLVDDPKEAQDLLDTPWYGPKGFEDYFREIWGVN